MFYLSKKALLILVVLMVIAFAASLTTLDWRHLFEGNFNWGVISGPMTALFLLILFAVDLINRNRKRVNGDS